MSTFLHFRQLRLLNVRNDLKYSFYYYSDKLSKDFIIFVTSDGIYRHDIENDDFQLVFEYEQQNTILFDQDKGNLMTLNQNKEIFNGYTINIFNFDDDEWKYKKVNDLRFKNLETCTMIKGEYNGIYFIENLYKRKKSQHFLCKMSFDDDKIEDDTGLVKMISSLNDMHINPKKYDILYCRMVQKILLIHEKSIYMADFNDAYLKWKRMNVQLLKKCSYKIAFGHILFIFFHHSKSICCLDLITQKVYQSHKTFQAIGDIGIVTDDNYYHTLVPRKGNKWFDHYRIDLLSALPITLMDSYYDHNEKLIVGYMKCIQKEFGDLVIPSPLHYIMHKYCPILF